MTAPDTVLDRLVAADPAATTTGFDPDQIALLLARATAAMAGPDLVVRHRRSGLRLGAAVAAAVVVGALAFVLLPGGVATPADARAVDSLLAAGRAAGAAVDAPLGPGQRFYSKTTAGSFTQATAPDGRTATSIQPSTREDWVAADGSGAYRQVVSGSPWYPTAADRQAYQRMWAGQGGVPKVGTVTTGLLDASGGSVNAPTYTYARTLPTDPAALEQLIRTETSGAGESPDVEVWVTVRDMLSWPVSPPALRSALYQVAAGVPGVEYLGTRNDDLGRSGVAVALDHGDSSHARTREVMVVDPTTGLLLESQEIALDPVQWGLPASSAGTVVGWQLFVTSAVVDGLGVRPDGTHVDLQPTAGSPGTAKASAGP